MYFPPYKNYPVVYNNEIELREILPDEIKDVVEISFYDGIKAATIEQAKAMHKTISEDYKNGNSIHWAIIDKISNKIVGTCGYYRGFKNETGELGCILLPQFTGNGFMTKALKLAVTFGQKEMMLKKIIAITSPENSKAINVLNRAGFVITQKHNESIEFEFNNNFIYINF